MTEHQGNQLETVYLAQGFSPWPSGSVISGSEFDEAEYHRSVE